MQCTLICETHADMIIQYIIHECPQVFRVLYLFMQCDAESHNINSTLQNFSIIQKQVLKNALLLKKNICVTSDQWSLSPFVIPVAAGVRWPRCPPHRSCQGSVPSCPASCTARQSAHGTVGSPSAWLPACGSGHQRGGKRCSIDQEAYQLRRGNRNEEVLV